MVHAEMSSRIGDPPPTGTPAAIGLAGQPAIDAAERRDQDAGAGGVDEVQRQLARLRRHQRPIADAAQMPRVAQGDDGDAVAGALVDAQLHRLLADGLAEAELAIDDGDGVVLEDDLDRAVREHLAGLEPLHVGRHADDAVRIVADEVRFDQVRGDALGLRPAAGASAVKELLGVRLFWPGGARARSV